MQRQTLLLLLGALVSSTAVAADRAIPVPARLSMSWGYVTDTTKVDPHRNPAVGFWQRASGAKPGVGAVFVAAMEYQLPEAPASRLRSASFQFSGTPSQCAGAEPVVIDIYAYTGDGQSSVADATAGTKIAQMSADCTDRAAFSRPIDVTNIVRQTTVASGVRFVGFNMRKANNRQGPGLFALAAGKLTVVIADQDIVQRPLAKAASAPAVGTAPVVAAMSAAAPAPLPAAVAVARPAAAPTPAPKNPPIQIGGGLPKPPYLHAHPTAANPPKKPASAAAVAGRIPMRQ
jgi:hypothetical protein